ncbi:MAG: aminotransferase class V-fold PLP-dependent enzyme, partial [Thaumarchaeota archaeon]|nr:aminotransferase class V-fold PLP-dependent enzyme [Nitrososphaerota archaeon]
TNNSVFNAPPKCIFTGLFHSKGEAKKMLVVERLLPLIRNEFPRADKDASGRARIFLDAGAGSLVLGRAAEAEKQSMLDYAPNLGAPSWESQKAEQAIVEGREAIRDLINAEDANCIVSGESATSLFFRLTYALSKELKKDENVVTTEYDHYANVSAVLELERRGYVKEARLARFDTQTGKLDLDHLASLIDSKTKVVSVAGVSNGLGSKTSLAEVAKLAKSVGAYFIVDAVHMVPHMPVDVQRIGCDFLVFSGYKVFSRKGSFMYGKKEVLEKLAPYKVDPAANKAPTKWEWGSLDQSLFASFSAVVSYLEWLGERVGDEYNTLLGNLVGRQRAIRAAMHWIENYEKSLSRTVLGGYEGQQGISDIQNLDVYGIKDPAKVDGRTPTFSMNVRGADYKKLAQFLWDKYSIATLPDDFYSRALRSYGVEKAVRASFAHYNTIEEARTLVSALSDAARTLSAS